MRTIVIALLFLSFQSIHAQTATTSADFKKLRVPYESECPSMNFCIDCGKTKAAFKGDLKEYLKDYVKEHKIYKKIDGIIQLQVIVDSMGNHCLKSITNNTRNSHEDVLNTGLDTVINHMQPWQPAIENGRATNSSIVILLYFNVVDRPRFDADYLRVDMSNVQFTKPTK